MQSSTTSKQLSCIGLLIFKKLIEDTKTKIINQDDLENYLRLESLLKENPASSNMLYDRGVTVDNKQITHTVSQIYPSHHNSDTSLYDHINAFGLISDCQIGLTAQQLQTLKSIISSSTPNI